MSLFERIKQFGWVNLTIDQDETLLQFAAALGTPVSDPFGSMNRFLVAKSHVSARRNTASGIYGFKRFPLHTDYAHLDSPPRYFMLRSHLGQSQAVTKLLNPLTAFGEIWLDLIGNATWRISSGVRTRAGIMRLQETNHGFRWDPYLMQPLNKFATSASTDLMRSLDQSTSIHEYKWEHSRQVLLIDNWHVLHGRSDVSPTEDRWMERVFLKEISCV